MATNSLQVEDFRDSSVDQFLWQIKLEPLMKAPQPVEEASENISLDGTKGFCQKGIPFKDLRLSRQKQNRFHYRCHFYRPEQPIDKTTTTKQFHSTADLLL